MKKIWIAASLFVFGIGVILNLSSFNNIPEPKEAEGNAHLILVEIYEVPNFEGKGVYVHWGNGKIDHYEFKDFNRDNHDENGEIILNTINKLEDQGYDIEHTVSGLAHNGMITKLFMRKTL